MASMKLETLKMVKAMLGTFRRRRLKQPEFHGSQQITKPAKIATRYQAKHYRSTMLQNLVERQEQRVSEVGPRAERVVWRARKHKQ